MTTLSVVLIHESLDIHHVPVSSPFHMYNYVTKCVFSEFVLYVSN